MIVAWLFAVRPVEISCGTGYRARWPSLYEFGEDSFPRLVSGFFG